MKKKSKKIKLFDFNSAYGRLVSIEWKDSQTTYGWRVAEEDDLPVEIKSIGFLVSDNKTAVTISTSVSEGLKFAEKLTIPKFAITKIRRLKIQ